MARLNLRRTAIAAGLLAACGSASADPITLLVGLSGVIGTTAAAFVVSYGVTIATVAYGLISSNQAKRKQAAAAAAQRSQYNAGLQDRNVTGLSAEAPWQIVYGQPAPVGGSLVALLGGAPRPIDYTGLNPALVNFVNSFPRPEIKHLVVVFAAHECQNIYEVFLDGEPIGTNALTANGDNTIGAFASTYLETITETLTFVAPGIATPSGTPAAVTTAVRTIIPPYDPGQGYDGGFEPPPYEVSATPVIDGVNLRIPALGTAPIVWTVTYQIARSIGFVNVQKHLGAGTDVADPYLRQATDAWTVNDKLTGYCYAVITLSQGLDRFKGGPPNISARIVGKKVYDFRTGVTAYSRNPALCLADFIQSEAGYGATLQQFDVPSIIAAANACDAQGFFCDGVFRTDQDRESTKQQLEDSFGGTCHQSGGVWRITPGAWTAPVMTLNDVDCAAPIQITQASYTSKERFNTVRGKYVPMDGLGVATDFTPLTNAAHLAADGFVKVLDLTLPFTGEHQRAQDLARMRIERSRGGLTITYPGQMRLWPLQPGDRVVINNAEFGWVAKPFRVTDWAFHPRSPVALTMVEDVAAYYDAANIIGVDASPNTNLPDPFSTQALLGLTAVSGTDQLLLQSDGTIITRVLWSWTLATQSYVLTGGTVERQWKRAADTSFSWNAIADESGAETSAFQDNAPDGENIICRARFVNQRGIPGAWSTINHFVIGKTAPPSDVIGLRFEFEGFGVRLYWSSVPDKDIDMYELRSGGTSWESSTLIAREKGTSYLWRVQAVGSVKVWIKAIDTVGNRSVSPGQLSIVVPPPNASNLSASIAGPNVVLNWQSVAGAYSIDRYEVRYGPTWATAQFVAASYTLSFSEKVTYGGARKYWVAAIDVAGNVGPAVAVDVQINNPAQTSIQAEIIDNNVLLRWTESTTTLPIDRYEIRKGASYALGTSIGDNGNGRFAAFFEQAAGLYTYWIVAYDTANNVSVPASVNAQVAQPPDYVLRSNIDSVFAGTGTGIWKDGGKVYAPLFNETWQQHFTSRGWASPQTQVTAGFPRYFQPSDVAAFYEETIDYGAALPATAITATLSSNLKFGAVTVTPSLAVKALAGDPWTNYPGQSQVVASNFRYVKVRFDFAASGGDDLIELTGLNIKLSTKLKSDAGDGVATSTDVGGTTVLFTTPFIDVNSITVTPKGTAARIAIYDFVDVPFPTSFKVLIFDTNGNRVSGPYSWAAKGT